MTFSMAASMRPDELPPEEIARYRAVMLVPNDITVFSFIEAFCMGVPTFVPTAEWLFRLRRTVPFGFLQPSATLPERLSWQVFLGSLLRAFSSGGRSRSCLSGGSSL